MLGFLRVLFGHIFIFILFLIGLAFPPLFIVAIIMCLFHLGKNKPNKEIQP